MIKEKKLANAEVFETEALAEVHLDIKFAQDGDRDEEDQWDADTILSTYTNTDNHPGVIRTQRRVRPSQRMKIELHKQFKVPIDGLIPLAEEITLKKERKAVANQPFTRVQKRDNERPAASPMGSANNSEDEDAVVEEDITLDKKAQKKLVKQQQAEKRKMKK